MNSEAAALGINDVTGRRAGPPETVPQGDRELDARSDVYSLGAGIVTRTAVMLSKG